MKATFLFLGVSVAGLADPLLSPQEAVKKMTAPPGFSVDLLAAEPDLVQPIAFCWDARGRIWVVEANTYPARRGRPPVEERDGGDLSKPSPAQLKDIFGGDDRVLIFEDADHNGSFETRKVFLERLNLVSGIELGFGGVYLGAAPYLLHIAIDDKTDKPAGDPRIMLDGFGWQDTHETLNSFIWGPDGWLYGCHGVFTHSEVRVCARGGAFQATREGKAEETRGQDGHTTSATRRLEGDTTRATRGQDGHTTPLNCGYWRYHPVRHEFEVFASGTSNSWGFDYNEYGDWFAEACVIPHFWHIIQGGYYLRQSNPLGHFNPHVYTNIETVADHQHFIGTTPHSGNNVSDEAGGGHAHCGLLIYNGDNFPPEYRGRAMMFNIHGQRINQENLAPQGSGYVAKHLPDFVKANDKNFTGVALKVGPDGAVYFIDWYDKEKCHRVQREVWDRSNGRMYRVKYDKTWKPWKGPHLHQVPDSEIRSRLTSSNGWMRRVALRQIAERSAAGTYTTENTTNGSLVDPYLEDLSRSGRPTPDKLMGLYGQEAAGLARAKWTVHADDRDPELVAASLKLAFDDLTEAATWEITVGEALIRDYLPRLSLGPRFRLVLASTLQRLPLNQRWPIAEVLIQHSEDATDHNLPQMYWYAIEPLVPTDPSRALELAGKSKIPLVAAHIARRLSEAEGGIDHLVGAMAKEKTAAGLLYLMKSSVEGLRGRVGVPAPQSWNGAYANIDDVLARRPDAAEHATTLRDLRTSLAVAFGDQRAFPGLRQTVLDLGLPAERRELALQVLVQGQDPELGGVLLKLLDDNALRLAALRALPQVK